MTRVPAPFDARGVRALRAALIVALLLRAAFGLFYWTGKPLTHDEREYLALAYNLVAGRGFIQDLPDQPKHPLVQQYGRAPIYPLFLTPLVWTDATWRSGQPMSEVPAAIKLAQSIVGTFSVYLLALLAARAAGARAGVMAGWIAALYPPLLWMCAYALSETLFTCLALSCVALLGGVLDRAEDARRPGAARRVLLGGLVAGVAILTRPAMLFFMPLEALLAWRRRFAYAVLLAVGSLIVVAPWIARNFATYHKFVLVASDGGVTFWTGNHPQATGEGDLAANPHLKRLNVELRARYPGQTEEQLEAVYYREAFQFIREHPGQWAWLMVKKAFYTWIPLGPSYRLHSPRYFWASVLSYGALLPFAVIGLARLLKSSPPWSVLWLALSAALVCLVFFPQERFRIPVIDPAVIVCAAVALAAFGRSRRDVATSGPIADNG